MKKPDPHLTILWILGIIAVLIVTEEFYQYNENWNKIRRQGITPALVSADGIANQSYAPLQKKLYRERKLPPYWIPYIFSGMPAIFNLNPHWMAVPFIKMFGEWFYDKNYWFYFVEMIPMLIVLWLEVLKPPVTPREIATAREDQKICKSLLLIIAGWLLFYWFYAEVR
ncbi:MAG TPA: hypothetical protein ENH82_13085 [bacterium]|nr:hypothetical protein [bacterium]